MIAKTVRLTLLAASAVALLSAADASAQTTVSQAFQVTASVSGNCRIDGAQDIAISTPAAPWDPTSGTNPTATGNITVRCTRGTQYTIDLNGGTYVDAMTHTNGTDTLPYRFYASNCTTDFTPIAFTATSRAPRAHTICAGLDLANAALDPIAGNYADTVVVDVTF
jgi:spore coat protein U-like protein